MNPLERNLEEVYKRGFVNKLRSKWSGLTSPDQSTPTSPTHQLTTGIHAGAGRPTLDRRKSSTQSEPSLENDSPRNTQGVKYPDEVFAMVTDYASRDVNDIIIIERPNGHKNPATNSTMAAVANGLPESRAGDSGEDISQPAVENPPPSVKKIALQFERPPDPFRIRKSSTTSKDLAESQRTNGDKSERMNGAGVEHFLLGSVADHSASNSRAGKARQPVVNLCVGNNFTELDGESLTDVEVSASPKHRDVEFKNPPLDNMPTGDVLSVTPSNPIVPPRKNSKRIRGQSADRSAEIPSDGKPASRAVEIISVDLSEPALHLSSPTVVKVDLASVSEPVGKQVALSAAGSTVSLSNGVLPFCDTVSKEDSPRSTEESLNGSPRQISPTLIEDGPVAPVRKKIERLNKAAAAAAVSGITSSALPKKKSTKPAAPAPPKDVAPGRVSPEEAKLAIAAKSERLQYPSSVSHSSKITDAAAENKEHTSFSTQSRYGDLNIVIQDIPRSDKTTEASNANEASQSLNGANTSRQMDGQAIDTVSNHVGKQPSSKYAPKRSNVISSTKSSEMAVLNAKTKATSGTAELTTEANNNRILEDSAAVKSIGSPPTSKLVCEQNSREPNHQTISGSHSTKPSKDSSTVSSTPMSDSTPKSSPSVTKPTSVAEIPSAHLAAESKPLVTVTAASVIPPTVDATSSVVAVAPVSKTSGSPVVSLSGKKSSFPVTSSNVSTAAVTHKAASSSAMPCDTASSTVISHTPKSIASSRTASSPSETLLKKPVAAAADDDDDEDSKPVGNVFGVKLKSNKKSKDLVPFTNIDDIPISNESRSVFDTRVSMGEKRKIPEYEKIHEGVHTIFCNDNVVVRKGCLRKPGQLPKVSRNIVFSGDVPPTFEYPSEKLLIKELPREPGADYADDDAIFPDETMDGDDEEVNTARPSAGIGGKISNISQGSSLGSIRSSSLGDYTFGQHMNSSSDDIPARAEDPVLEDVSVSPVVDSEATGGWSSGDISSDLMF